MFNLLKRLTNSQYHFLNTIYLSKPNLIDNYNYLSGINPDFKIAPVLKSNAYGHGLVETAKILEPLNPPFICVDSLHEAYRLYKAKISTPILIMGYFDPQNLRVKKLPFSYVVWDLETARIISKYQAGAHIHIKVDTGMHRLGVPIKELPKFLEEIKLIPDLKIEGLMSHFAHADDAKNPLFTNQIKNFKLAQNIFSEAGIKPKWIHISASNALLNPATQQTIFEISNLARVGKGLYGIAPFDANNQLKPVLKLTSKIAQIKTIQKGESVGYDGTYKAKRDTVMGVLPIGYNDGVDRRLSNKGAVTIDKVVCPIIGRVSMNITTVDISKVTNPHLNQEVVVYSDSPQDPNSINNSAQICDTIAHELLVHIDPATKRIVTS